MFTLAQEKLIQTNSDEMLRKVRKKWSEISMKKIGLLIPFEVLKANILNY